MGLENFCTLSRARNMIWRPTLPDNGIQLSAGSCRQTNPLSLSQTDREVATYVIKGTGRLEVNGRSFELIPGSAAMLLKDSTVSFHAEKELELLLGSVLAPAS